MKCQIDALTEGEMTVVIKIRYALIVPKVDDDKKVHPGDPMS